jgi:hypothetical protein
VGVGVAVGVTVGVGEGVGVGVTVGVGVIGGVGVGDPPPGTGTMTSTVIGPPVLKKPMVAAAVIKNSWGESKLKLYNVPQRIAFAFGFCAKVSVLQVTDPATSQGVLLYPASPTVPSCAHPGCCGGAWNPILVASIAPKLKD